METVSTFTYDQKRVELIVKRLTAPYYRDLTIPLLKDEYKTVTIDGVAYEENFARYDALDELMRSISGPTRRYSLYLFNLEMEELHKAGPKSWIPPTPWWRSLDAYYRMHELNYDADALAVAQDKVFRRIGQAMDSGYFIPLDKVKVPQSTFSGLPWLTTTRNVENEIMSASHRILEEVSKGNMFSSYPSLIGHRGQSKGPHMMAKQRCVWMYPKAPVVVGLSWFQSVMPRLATMDEFVGWNNQVVIDQAINKGLAIARNNGVNGLSMDLSHFDDSITPVLVSPYFERLALSGSLAPLLYDFFHSPIITPDGLMDGRQHGVPSGHAWTNFIDSLANLTMIYYIAERSHADVLFSTVMGDDSFVVYSKEVDMAKASEYASEIGLQLNADKTIVSPIIAHYLQRLYVGTSRTSGIRSLVRTMNSILSLEKWSREMGPMYLEARMWMQLNDVAAHPCRETLLHWILKRDRLKLMLDDPDALVRIRSVINDTSLGQANSWRGTHVSTKFWFYS